MIHNNTFMSCLRSFFLLGTDRYAFSANGSTGGTDIIAAIVNKYRDISLGRVIANIGNSLSSLPVVGICIDVGKKWFAVTFVLFISSFVLDRVVWRPSVIQLLLSNK
ncbi:MAG: YitT family protein, partial [Phocaeicola sp.]